MTTKPLIKWAGGKRQLLPEIKKLMPAKYNKYYEPFVGGGALFFELQPLKAVINDTNTALINVYKQVKDCPHDVIKHIKAYTKKYNSFKTDEERKKYYYKLREEFNSLLSHNIFDIGSAALFIVLNKLGYNGLYRVNSEGLYNVPWNKKKQLELSKDEYITNLLNVSKVLKNTTILNLDFEKSLKGVRKGDFVFFDSPYYDTFDTYQKGGFSEENHIRLAKLYKKLSERGVYCMLTNSNTKFIKDLYKDYNIKVINVKRMINCDGNSRTGQEVIITNYK